MLHTIFGPGFLCGGACARSFAQGNTIGWAVGLGVAMHLLEQTVFFDMDTDRMVPGARGT